MSIVSNYGNHILRASSDFLRVHKKILDLACNVDKICITALGARNFYRIVQSGCFFCRVENITASSWIAEGIAVIGVRELSMVARDFRNSLFQVDTCIANGSSGSLEDSKLAICH